MRENPETIHKYPTHTFIHTHQKRAIQIKLFGTVDVVYNMLSDEMHEKWKSNENFRCNSIMHEYNDTC